MPPCQIAHPVPQACPVTSRPLPHHADTKVNLAGTVGELRSAARFASTCVSIIQLPKRASRVQRPQLGAPILTPA